MRIDSGFKQAVTRLPANSTCPMSPDRFQNAELAQKSICVRRPKPVASLATARAGAVPGAFGGEV